MNIKMALPNKKLIIFLSFILFFILPFSLTAEEIKKGNEFDNIIQRLIQDGFEKEKIQNLYSNKNVFFTTKGVHLFYSRFEPVEKAKHYEGFATKQKIVKAAKYMARHKDVLDRVEKEYDADKTIITAVLLVESQLGTYPMKYLAINMLSTIASLSEAPLQERIWNSISKKRKPKKETFLKRADKKSEWAYAELKALINYMDKEGLAPERVKGSFAGAIGICQFMPTNIPKLAKDGNKDGVIDLLNHEDAIYSIANYFKQHGWKSGLSRQKQYNVIYKYNHDNHYVDAIQKISDKLKE